ncbi:hypothetical protein K7X08_013530 [Anisodus acutangulus]|uniref:Myb-like domain-containing protein n=1 Tax=Anisodus acutangulus TaxID=402998 RepID=A0A9Q1LNL4_9SOLA|nr:hypothetical protein K7X08_013530 [Anisodus acutangulus]
MDDIEDNGIYPPNPYGMNQGYESFNRQKLPIRDTSYSRDVDNNQYVEEADDDEDVEEEVEEEEDDDDDGDENGVQRIGKDVFEDDDDDDDYGDLQRHQKKRKLKSLLSSYEFAPRVPPPQPSTTVATAPKTSFGGRNPLSDWSEHETFILLDAWGTRFVRHGRKSLRSEEWQEVAERVSQGSKIERTDTQCRNRLDTLKKKYKKEKMKFAVETGSSTTSKWVYFKKMDMLLTSTPQQAGVSCGMDSGEYVFMSPKAYINRANSLDEMRDSPANSGSAEGEEDDSEDLPPKRSRNGRSGGNGNFFKLIADSIHKFSEIYVKIENSKRQQMLELEKMRMDFHRELELQKRQIMERAYAEIARIRQGSDEENDMSAD